MAFEITERAQNALDQSNIGAQIILEIEGIDTIYGAVEIEKLFRLDDGYLFDDGLNFDSLVPVPGQKDYISVKGTTKNITQQIQVDKANASSASSVTVDIIDKNNEVSSELSLGATVADLLSRKAKLYYGLQGTSHPEDSLPVFSGLVSDLSFGPGNARVRISHPDQIKRQQVFIQAQTLLNGAIGSGDTTITVDDTSDFIVPGDLVRTYILIEEEIIEYTGKTDTTFTGCVRGSLNTIAAAHSDNTESTSFYRLTGEPIIMALKLMLSGGSAKENNEANVTSFVKIGTGAEVSNAIQTTSSVLEQQSGITIGDKCTVTGATNGANNFTDRTILDIASNDGGFYIIVDGAALVSEVDSSAVITFSSQYDTLPDGAGLGMTMDQVDVARHQELDDLFTGSFNELDIYVKDTVEGKDLINEQVYFPSGLYAIPRKSRSSCNMTIPPLSFEKVIEINKDNILNPDKIIISRSINDFFYNNVVYRYEEDSLEDKFRRIDRRIAADSVDQIKVGNRPLEIEAKGFRDNALTTNTIIRTGRRFLDRYKFCSEFIKNIELNLKVGYDIEVGDAVLGNFNDIKVVDNTNNTREFVPRLFECVNKSIDITGRVKVDLVDTAFSNDGRYGVVSPSSYVSTGSTTTTINLKKSFTTKDSELETIKYQDVVGEQIIVRSPDYSVSEVTTLNAISLTKDDQIIVDPALSFAALEDYIIELAPYDGGVRLNPKSKDLYVYLNPQLTVVSGASNTVFDVSAPDASLMFVGSYIEIVSTDYATISTEVQVTDITGTTITVDEDLGFTPSAGQLINLVGFVSDEGLPYRLI